MPLPEAIRTRRTVRLYQQKPLSWKDLEEIIEAARLAPSARNLQPLEYVVVTDEKLRKEMFSCMGFGGLIPDFKGKEPVAYVIVLVNKSLKGDWTSRDCGLAVENLVLAAWEKGIGSCILARIDRDRIRSLLRIPDKYEIDLVVTLGYPAEKPVIEEMSAGTDYRRDDKGVLHVPKRRLKDILRRNGF